MVVTKCRVCAKSFPVYCFCQSVCFGQFDLFLFVVLCSRCCVPSLLANTCWHHLIVMFPGFGKWIGSCIVLFYFYPRILWHADWNSQRSNHQASKAVFTSFRYSLWLLLTFLHWSLQHYNLPAFSFFINISDVDLSYCFYSLWVC